MNNFFFISTNILLIFFILVYIPNSETKNYGGFLGSPKTENELLIKIIWSLIFIYLGIGIAQNVSS